MLTGDHHTGSTVALSPPVVRLDDGNDHKASKAVRALWSYWLECWQEFERLSAGYTRVWIANGDLIDYDHKRRGGTQYFTNNRADLVRAAIETMTPGLDICDRVFVVRGTMAHTGSSGELEELLAQDIVTAVHSQTAASWWQLRQVFAGSRFDVTHHTSMGGREWTFANAANALAANTIMQYAAMGERPPDFVIRSHVHRTADSGDNYATRAIILPAWQLITEYGYRRDPNRISQVGAVFVLLEDGARPRVEKMIRLPYDTGRLWQTFKVK